eukprot:Seg10052.1 transcript_id=Seg10052.1/GoldUCD/mRNA.D3Y31 product="hypothetical protein" protein_id=Seg10052.1/GoldUCD/D3Y31
MDSKKKINEALTFRNFSPYSEKAVADAKRDENLLKLVKRDIDRRKHVSYSHLMAAQRMVEKDLYELRMSKKRYRDERSRREVRSFSDPGLNMKGFGKERVARLLSPGDDLYSKEKLKDNNDRQEAVLPMINERRSVVSNPEYKRSLHKMTDHFCKWSRVRGRKSFLSTDDEYQGKQRFTKSASERLTSEDLKAATQSLRNCSTSFSKSVNTYDGQF